MRGIGQKFRKSFATVIFMLALVLMVFYPALDVKADEQEDAAYTDESKGAASDFVTKKGLQGANLYEEQYADLGVKHTLFNTELTYLVATPYDCDVEYEYNGNTYYFNYIMGLWPEQVHQYNRAGITISLVLLLPMDTSGIVEYNMIHPDARDKSVPYYAWNLEDPLMVELYNALFDFLASTYGRNDDPEWACYIQNWIIGNEVNMPNHYNYTGTTDVDRNAELYAKQFKLVNDALKRYNTSMKAYISVEHSWNHDNEGEGIKTKSFIDAFAQKIYALQPGIDWNIAYHAYPAIMTESDIWDSSYTSKNINSQFVSGYNIDVLTNYIKNTYGSDVRIILSEQGFTCYKNQYEEQAAAMAYTYYMAEFDDMIDAVIFRALYDTPHEAANKFNFGLLNDDGSKRPVYDVFKFMDTEYWQAATAQCLETIGESSWANVIPNFNPGKFANLNGLVQSPDGVWRFYRNGVVDTTYTGMVQNEYGWWYVVNGILDWTYTGMASNEYGWWYFTNGVLDWTYTGMASNEYGWWYYTNGQLDWAYTGMASNEYGWWYYTNGQLNWTYTGMASNEYGWWYYTNGQLDWTYTGMASNEFGWWYYTNGQLDWTYTGIATNEYGSWYYQNGYLDLGFTGTVNIGGVLYNIVNGMVV